MWISQCSVSVSYTHLVQGEFDPANPGPDVRIPYIKNQNEEIFQPLFSDIGEFQKFRPDPQAKLRLAAIPFQHLLPYLMKQAKGFVINPSGFNLLLTREQLQLSLIHISK